ncbi:MFS transporter [Propioniciclava coleopterorum]|uniref:MFS transporter n=1 Tax=Propioniciclava coleopterorum TaxID=2714937 RepID=A0A6G7Y7L3_9ACTN|nr:MFS transporter [Propioniciclava coleopterorum]QIK72638.1 MFS transporter [Propioniciclava coleopterorum]
MSTPASPPAPGRDPGSPLRHPGFRLLLAGQALSQFGFQFELLAMPVIAVTLLHATEAEMGYLNAANTAAFLLVGLLAGGWVDRMRKRRVMIVADWVRALAICAIPVLWATGVLHIWHLYVIAGVVGVATVFFDVGYQSYLPILVPSAQVGRANGVLEGVAQVARLGGPGVAGGLLAVIAAPFLMLANAIGFALSAFLLGFIRDDEVPAPASERQNLFVEIREGIAFVASQPLLRLLVTTTGLSNLGSTIVFTLLTLVVLRDVGAPPAMLGVLFTAGAVGGIIGSLLAARLAERLGEGVMLRLSMALAAVATALFPVAAGLDVTRAIVVLSVAEVVLSFCVVSYNMVQVTARQRLCPPRLLGRMNASIRFVVWGIMPLGALLAGGLGSLIGARETLWVGALVQALSALPFLLSAYGSRRELPRAPE